MRSSSIQVIGHFNRATRDKDGNAIAEERLLTTLDEQICALSENSQSWIYFFIDSGRTYRIKPAIQ